MGRGEVFKLFVKDRVSKLKSELGQSVNLLVTKLFTIKYFFVLFSLCHHNTVDKKKSFIKSKCPIKNYHLQSPSTVLSSNSPIAEKDTISKITEKKKKMRWKK